MIARLQRGAAWVGASSIRAYGLAILSTIGAALARYGVEYALDSRPTYSLFSFGVLLTAVFGGVRAAVLAMALSVVVIDVVFLSPTTVISLNSRDVLELMLFMCIAGGMIILSRLTATATQQAETAISAQRQLSDKLQTEEATQRAILATIPDAMVVIDENGIVQSFSTTAEELFGYRADEVCGQNVRMLMPQPFRDEHDGYLSRFRRTGEARIIGRGRTVTALKKDGTTFPMDLAVGEARVAGKRTFIGFIRDLTTKLENERHMQHLQNELLHASRLTAMGEMSAALAHELNQPLTAIANYSKAARRTLAAGADKIDDVQGMMDKVAAQALRAGQIIRRLRDFVEHREMTRAIESPVKVVEEAMALALADVVDTRVRVQSRLEASAPPIYIDKIQIQQVLVNLIRNAVEAMQSTEHRVLVVTVEPEQDDAGHAAAHIAVCDTGPGLAQEVAARLFQPFVTTKKTGMGVGLSICHSIVTSHGGRIWVTPNESAGVTFHLSIPAYA